MPSPQPFSRTWLDRLVGLVSPRAELARLQYRAAANSLVAHYEGAGAGRRFENWATPALGPTAAGTAALSTLRNRSRDLTRNNPWARNAVEDLETETVGAGILAKVKAPRARQQKVLAALWKAWAESTACDADGLHDLFGLQALAFRTIAESGEVLIRRRIRRLEDGLPLPFQLQVLEPDHLDGTRDVVRGDGSRIVGGIEFDALGRRAAYWLFPEHPGESFGVYAGKSSVRVPAANVLHLFRVERPGQVRGIPWAASAIVRLRNFDELEDAVLMREKIASCFGVFIHDGDGSSAPPPALAGVDGEPSEAGKPPIERVFPGMIEHLPPGKEVTFGTPPGPQGFGEYSSTVLRAIAAGYGTTPEALTGNYAGMPFSSSRLSWIRHARRVDAWRWRIVVPRLCVPVFGWALEVADAGLGTDVRDASASWYPPGRDVLDPKNEIVSTRTSIRAGLQSLSAAIRERGGDPDETFAELEADRDRLDELGLILESDARRAANGQPGETGGAPAPAQPAGPDDEDEDQPDDEAED